MTNERNIAIQIRKLASDPDTQHHICREETCMNGLLQFVQQSADKETLCISLQAFYFLSAHPENQKILLNLSGFLLRLAHLSDENENTTISTLAQKILNNLQGAVNEEENTDNTTKRTSLTNTQTNTNSIPNTGSSNNNTKENEKGNGNAAQRSRYLFATNLLWQSSKNTPEEREKVEKICISLKGVVSVTLNKSGQLMIYSKKQDDDLIDVVIKAIEAANPEWKVQRQDNDTNKENQSISNIQTPLPAASTSSPTVSVNSDAAGKSGYLKVGGYPTATSGVQTSNSRALATHASYEANNLQNRFQNRRKAQVQTENKQGMVKGIFSSVTSYFW